MSCWPDFTCGCWSVLACSFLHFLTRNPTAFADCHSWSKNTRRNGRKHARSEPRHIMWHHVTSQQHRQSHDLHGRPMNQISTKISTQGSEGSAQVPPSNLHFQRPDCACEAANLHSQLLLAERSAWRWGIIIVHGRPSKVRNNRCWVLWMEMNENSWNWIRIQTLDRIPKHISV